MASVFQEYQKSVRIILKVIFGAIVSDILLRELSNTDIDWMVTSGARHQMAPDDILIRPGEALEQLLVLLEGTLSVRLPKTPSLAASQSSFVDTQEIANISRGEVFGESWLIAFMVFC